MRVGLYADTTIPLAVTPLCNILNSLCRVVRFVPGTEGFRLATPSIQPPTRPSLLGADLQAEAATFDLACLATSVPYDNNFFFESLGDAVVISFSGWNVLTDLPIANGLVYFAALLILRHLGLGEAHDEATGCINDFRWDKGGVDVGMRAAFVCRACLAHIPTNVDTLSIVADVDSVLDFLSRASRAHRDVLSVPVDDREYHRAFDVFLCHNSEDKPAVRHIKSALQAGGISTWLDEEQLPLGRPWQAELEREIGLVRSAAVFVGKTGIGPWQDVEIRGFLDEFVRRACPVIPVLLPDASAAPELPVFLRQMTWVDLRREYEANLRRLVAGIRTSRDAHG